MPTNPRVVITQPTEVKEGYSRSFPITDQTTTEMPPVQPPTNQNPSNGGGGESSPSSDDTSG